MKTIAAQLLCILALTSFALADDAAPAAFKPPEFQNVGVDEHPDAQIPLDLRFLNENSQIVTLRQYFATGRPVVLQLGYYGCPKLCDVISRALVDTARDMTVLAGKDFSFLFVSIDPAETADLAAMKRQSMIEEYGHKDAADGFHCLVGQDRNIHALADAVGFRYHQLEVGGQFAHPAVLFVLTPDGKVSRYLYGIGVPKDTLKYSLVEASAGKIGSSWDRLALLICCYDVVTGKYQLAAVGVMRLAAVGTMLAMGVSAFWLFRHGRPGKIQGL